MSRGCRLGLASGRWRRGSLNNLTKHSRRIIDTFWGGCTTLAAAKKVAGRGQGCKWRAEKK